MFDFPRAYNYSALFEKPDGTKETRTLLGCACHESATVEAVNIAYDNDWELLDVAPTGF